MLEILAPHSGEILAIWRRELRALSLHPDAILPGISLDFTRLADRLRKTDYPRFRLRLERYGQRLAQKGVSLDRAVRAFNRLFEISLQNLIRHFPQSATPVLALARLHTLVTLLVVSGYTGQSAAGKRALLEASLAENEHRRHETSADVTRIYEQERRRLSRDLHDEVGHDLILIKLYLEMIAMEHKKKKLEDVQPRIAGAIALVSNTIDAVRRLVHDLGPAIFEDLGFLPAIKSYVRQFSAHSGIQVTLQEGNLPEEVPMTHRIALYRVMQGALSNVLKHASAKNVKVSLGSTRGSVLNMVIEDDGVGFDTTAALGRRSFGLTAMQERVEVLGGEFRLRSKPAAPRAKLHGTRIQVELPLPGGDGQ